MQLWKQGNAGIRIVNGIGDGRLKILYGGKLIKVMRSEVADYCDDVFWSVFDVWYKWRVFQGLPFAGGWAEQPAHLIEAIEAAEAGYKITED